MRGSCRSLEGGSEALESEVPGWQPTNGEEAFDVHRISDDCQSLVVTDELDFAIWRGLGKLLHEVEGIGPRPGSKSA